MSEYEQSTWHGPGEIWWFPTFKWFTDIIWRQKVNKGKTETQVVSKDCSVYVHKHAAWFSNAFFVCHWCSYARLCWLTLFLHFPVVQTFDTKLSDIYSLLHFHQQCTIVYVHDCLYVENSLDSECAVKKNLRGVIFIPFKKRNASHKDSGMILWPGPASLNVKETNWYKNLGMIIIHKNTLPFALQTIIFALKLFFLAIKVFSNTDRGKLDISNQSKSWSFGNQKHNNCRGVLGVLGAWFFFCYL